MSTQQDVLHGDVVQSLQNEPGVFTMCAWNLKCVGCNSKVGVYPASFVEEILVGLKEQLKADGSLSELDMKVSGPVPTQSVWSDFDKDSLETCVQYYDDITGEELPPDLVEAGKQEELRWASSINLYDKVDRSVATSRGFTPIPVRLVYVSKGDKSNYNVRCSLVSKELKAKTKEALLAHEVFSATPPWEIVKLLVSLLVCDGSHNTQEKLEIGVYDISRAHFMAQANRELYIELPEEACAQDRPDIGESVKRMAQGMSNPRTAHLELLKRLGRYLVANPSMAIVYKQQHLPHVIRVSVD